MTKLSEIAARLERDLPEYTESRQFGEGPRYQNVTLFPSKQVGVDVLDMADAVFVGTRLHTYSPAGRDASIPNLNGRGRDGETVSLHLTPEQYDALAAVYEITLPMFV